MDMNAIFKVFGATTCSIFALQGAALAQPMDASPADESAAMDDSGYEIVVLARKRAESIQDVPVSVTAINAATIERNNIIKIDQIAAVTPNVNFQQNGTIPTSIAAYIRGIGSRAADPIQDLPIAISIDGVYLSDIAGSLVDVFDVQQVEVLRGPQGTLQGRNSPGGAINITTRRPTGELGARFEASYARFDEVQLKGAVEGPIAGDVVAAKLSAFFNDGGNFMTNINTGKRTNGGLTNWGGRVGVLLTPTPDFTAYLTADYVRDTSPQSAIRAVPHAGPRGPLQPEPRVCSLFGFCSPLGKYETGATYLKHNSAKTGGVGLNADWDIGSVTLTSVTGYRYANEIVNVDNEGLPPVIVNVEDRTTKIRAVSQELRLASNGNGPLDYVVGVYASRSRFNLFQPLRLGGPLVGQPEPSVRTAERSQVTKSFAIFGQASYNITDQWSVSGGARKTFDRKKLTAQPSVPGPEGTFKAKFDDLSIEAGTEFRFSPGKLAYFRFSQGYRAGGLNGSAPLTDINVYEPEKVNSYEVGLKTEWLDNRLIANLSGFYYDYSDLQIIAVDATPRGAINRIVNVEGATIYGLELESTFRPSEVLTFSGSLGYLHTEYRSQIANLGFGPIDLKGLPKDFAPKLTGYFAVDYTVPLGEGDNGALVFNADVSYKSKRYTNPIPNPVSVQNETALVNAAVTYRTADERYSVTLFGRNLTNKYYKLTGETGGGLFTWDSVGRPRTYGIRATAKF